MASQLSYSASRYSGYRAPVVDRVNLVALLRRGLRMFRSRWWIALVTLSIASGIGIYRAMTTPDTYRAASRLGIAPRIAFSQRSSDRAVVLEEKNNFAEDQLEYMRGSQVVGKVEEKMQDFRPPDGSEPPKKRLNVTQGQGSTFIMSVESENLEFARRFARTWAQEFLAFKEEMRSAVARRSMDKTRADLSRQEERVAEAQQRVDEFLREHRIATSADTGNAAQELLVNLQRRQQSVILERQRLEMKSAEELADERTAGLDAAAAIAAPTAASVPTPASATAASAPTATASTGAAGAETSNNLGDSADPLDKFLGKSSYRDLKLRMRTLEAELARQAEALKPLHPYMIRLDQARVETERQIREQLAIIEEMRKARIASLKQEDAVLDRQIEAKRGEVEKLKDVARQFQKLTEEYTAEKVLLTQFSRELQAVSQIQASDEQITILEEGAASDKPIGPNRARIIISGIAIGLLSGIGLIFLLHRLDDRIDSAEELEKSLEEPILGQIPLVSRRDFPGGGFVSVDELEPNNIFVEAFRGVRSSVMFGDLGGAKQVLMATSSVPGDGKSTFTVNFAITLAKAGNRVLLIDADLRRGSIAEAFGLPSQPGLCEVLGGLENWTDVLNATKHRTLLTITAGKGVTNPGELLLSRVMKRMIEEARREFDYIIFDSPPVIGMDDAPTLATHCDGLIFVYRVGVTSLKLAKLAVNLVRQRGGRILGMILNGVSVANPDYYYTAYYYSHYTYGRGARATLPEGDPRQAHRPEGARLLVALREADPGPGDATPPAALLGDQPGTVDVQVSDPAVDKKDAREGA
ncbi:MAG: polysaccharide biosynthesis tyrosine autokinase [Verrucomicrobiales bacterium]|nr:polysaccharide biosynthesis tyrosine autokinase [Verrucomicrobiales bacterium]